MLSLPTQVNGICWKVYPMKLIDTHSHLYSEKFLEDIEEVIDRASSVNQAIFLPNIDQGSVGPMHHLVERVPSLFFPMMGLHPCYVPEDFESILTEFDLKLQSGNYYAVGETGLDLYWDKSSIGRQKESLQAHILWAKREALPIILHARNAIDEVYEMIAENHDESLWGIFHCFDGSVKQAQKICELGNFKLGIGGNVTYRKDVPKVLKEVLLDYIVLETDSPYLAPEPFRRQRNESSYTRFVAQKLVEIYEAPYAEIANITTKNALEVFKKYLPEN